MTLNSNATAGAITCFAVYKLAIPPAGVTTPSPLASPPLAIELLSGQLAIFIGRPCPWVPVVTQSLAPPGSRSAAGHRPDALMQVSSMVCRQR